MSDNDLTYEQVQRLVDALTPDGVLRISSGAAGASKPGGGILLATLRVLAVQRTPQELREFEALLKTMSEDDIRAGRRPRVLEPKPPLVEVELEVLHHPTLSREERHRAVRSVGPSTTPH